MRELRVGDPANIATDVGPLIDREAQRAHRGASASSAGVAFAAKARCPLSARTARSSRPTLIDIDSIAELKGEVFGRCCMCCALSGARSSTLIDAINATGYGLDARHRLTHRCDASTRSSQRARVGNVYVNRNIIGAVVGVQPFGGQGLSGTGPKAGGPLYLHRLLRHAPGPHVAEQRSGAASGAARQLIDWLAHGPALQLATDRSRMPASSRRALRAAHALGAREWRCGAMSARATSCACVPRGIVRATARSPRALLEQLAAALATGNTSCRIDDAPLAEALRAALAERAASVVRAKRDSASADAVLVDRAEAKHGRRTGSQALRSELAAAEVRSCP